MVVISVVKVKNTALPASISGSVELNEKESTASTMTGSLTGQFYSEKTD
jgi:hypothetical protein